ncbi:hypothetical protein ACWCQW_54830 [Streptomyces mirabilis]
MYVQPPDYAAGFKRLGFTDEDCTGGGSDRLVDALVARGTDDDHFPPGQGRAER